jgi:peptidoglycan/LPS O-acetylase OafA/YrhL
MRAPPTVLRFAAALGFAAIIAMVAYAASHSSGHTGWEPFTTLWLFIPLAVAGAVSLKKSGRPAAFALGIGLAGISLVVCLDQTNRLVQYERWVKRGMP